MCMCVSSWIVFILCSLLNHVIFQKYVFKIVYKNWLCLRRICNIEKAFTRISYLVFGFLIPNRWFNLPTAWKTQYSTVMVTLDVIYWCPRLLLYIFIYMLVGVYTEAMQIRRKVTAPAETTAVRVLFGGSAKYTRRTHVRRTTWRSSSRPRRWKARRDTWIHDTSTRLDNRRTRRALIRVCALCEAGVGWPDESKAGAESGTRALMELVQRRIVKSKVGYCRQEKSTRRS